MAALTFLVLNSVSEVYQLTCVFIGSGLSFSKTWNYIKTARRYYLYERYRKESWLRAEQSTAYRKKCQNSINASTNAACQLGRGRQSDSNRISSRDDKKIRNMSGVDDFIEIGTPSEAFDFVDDYYRSEPGGPVEEFGAEVVDGACLSSYTFNEYADPLPIYSNSSIGEIYEGVSFTVSGKVRINCESFSINLIHETPTRDIALHVNPRLPQNYIVRNARIKNIWGKEEVPSPLPFSLRRGSKFTIQILVTNQEYLISVNSHHFASFRHRLPYKSVTCLEVKGDVDDVNVKRSEVTEYPHRLPDAEPRLIQKTYNLKPENGELLSAETSELVLPYYGILPASLTAGRCIKINGRVKLLPHSFYVNLQSGQQIWPHPIIAFHFNPRFALANVGKHVICRNSWVNGAWDKEERSELSTDFCPGRSFRLEIQCTSDSYEVYLNKKLVCEYRFRGVDPKLVDTVYIQGDIKIWSVELDSKPGKEEGMNLYSNPTYERD